MVCEKCEQKLGKIATPDVWKDGARNTVSSGKVKLGENKLLSGKKSRFSPYSVFKSCRLCKDQLHQSGYNYCPACAYKKGICGMCGVKILDTSSYKQSTV